MDYDYMKILATVIGSASATGGLFFTVGKMYFAYLNRHKYRKFSFTQQASGQIDVIAEGLTVPEMMKLVDELPAKSSVVNRKAESVTRGQPLISKSSESS